MIITNNVTTDIFNKRWADSKGTHYVGATIVTETGHHINFPVGSFIVNGVTIEDLVENARKTAERITPTGQVTHLIIGFPYETA